MFKNILVSVSDKTGLAEFLRPFAQNGARIVSTGGTSKFLEQSGIRVVQVSDQTGFPEVMDGRVRTLHPNIHMALLARKNVPEDQELLKKYKLGFFDLVIVNLYPFEQKLKENLSDDKMIEFIDVGGPSMLRAAAKNFESVAVVCDTSDYKWLSEKSALSFDERRALASKVFAHTAQYDSHITNYLSGAKQSFVLRGDLVQELRYGENPQQNAAWFRSQNEGLHDAKILQGKPLSYNNLLDLEAAIECVREFDKPTVVAVKHNSPCGVGSNVSLALAADPISVFGGIVALNFALKREDAEKISSIFLECVIAPDLHPDAEAVLKSKKNLRVLVWPNLQTKDLAPEVRTLSGGFLLQSRDHVTPWQDSWRVIGEKPSEDIRSDLEFAWKVARHLKSNAIAIVENGQTLGLGMGQVNRVEAVEHALHRMKTHHPKSQRAVLASDAFFPFSDSIELIARFGIRWVIQPGGSLKDEEVIECARQKKLNIILTGERHFRH